MKYVSLTVLVVCLVCIPTASSRANWVLPTRFDDSRVGNCRGNCGAGCSDSVNPCGGPPQYWDAVQITEGSLLFDYWHESCEGDGVWWYHEGYFIATFRFTYHGWASAACQEHDSLCPEVLVIGCIFWFGCSPGYTYSWSYDDTVTGYFRIEGSGPYGPCQQVVEF